jgi:probable rRNA maturation factor
MHLNFFFEETDKFRKPVNLKARLQQIIEKEDKMLGEINIVFCSDDYLLKINKEYLKHDYYTDIITFDYSEQTILSGEIFISVDRVKENATTYKIPFMNELIRVMIHGILHLAGYDDKNNKAKKQMTEKEDFYMNQAFDLSP